MDYSFKASSLPRTAAFLSFLSPLTTTKNPVGSPCKPALSRFWQNPLPTSSYSNGFVQPYVKTALPVGQDCAEDKFEEIIGNSSALQMALAEVERVAPTDSTVLILGETGTGKELIAQTIHNVSR